LARQLHSASFKHAHFNMRILPRVKYDRSASFGDFYRIPHVPHKLGERHEPSQPIAGLQNAQPSYRLAWIVRLQQHAGWTGSTPVLHRIHKGFGGLWSAARVSGAATRYARADVAKW
jgi:hypothetical protein